MSRRNKTFKLSELSDEQIQELIDSVESNFENDDETSDSPDYSDDSIADPNYNPDPIELEVDELIDNAIQDMNLGESSHAFIGNQSNLSFDITSAASSTLHPAAVYEIVDDVNWVSPDETATENVIFIPLDADTAIEFAAANSAEDEEVAAATSSAVRSFKPAKRARSPLPAIEASGPSITPNAGGFLGIGKQNYSSQCYFFS